MDKKEIIKKGMATKCFTEEFILLVYNEVLYKDEEKELLGDYLPYLEANKSATIETINDLKREFRRFNSSKYNPQERELWLIISAKLLDLEKKGITYRSADDKKHHNSKNTVWWIESNESKEFELSELFNLDVKYQKQGEHNKILSPTNAETFILEIFKKAQSALSMEEIVYIVKNNIEMYKEESLDEDIPQDDGQSSKHDIIAGTELLSDIYIQVEDEGNSRSAMIWDKIIKIERGNNQQIKGNKIFCLYLLPKHSDILQPRLEDFGPSATVSDLVKNDLQPILKKYLYFEKNSCDNLAVFEIQKYIFSKLNKKCSEIGYNTNLDV